MREISYRVWVREEKIMLNVDTISFLAGGIKVYDACMFEGWCQVNDEFKDKIEVDCDLMQYTGIDDKNGKPIYEGDIVHYENIEESGFFEVAFENCGFYANWIKSETITDIQNSLKYLQCSKELEVISNIHENPELLNNEEIEHERD